jgi:hypothetical protein
METIGSLGIFVGITSYLFLERLGLQLLPFLAAYLVLGIVGALLMPSVPGVICILAAVALLCLSLGLRWWKNRQQMKA